MDQNRRPRKINIQNATTNTQQNKMFDVEKQNYSRNHQVRPPISNNKSSSNINSYNRNVGVGRDAINSFGVNESMLMQNHAASRQLNTNKAYKTENVYSKKHVFANASNSHTGRSSVQNNKKVVNSAKSAGAKQNKINGSAQNKGKKAVNIIVNIVCVVCFIFVSTYSAIQVFASTLINTGSFGSVSKNYQTPPQYAGDELNVLVLGIDYTSIDGQDRNVNGQTDVIMYVRFNFADNTIRMLQIPRDVYVGEEIDHGRSGKINGVYGSAPNDEDRVNSLAYVLYEQYKLPVDNYVSIDMDSLRDVVDIFDGIQVYVSEDMYFEGSKLEQGWRWLDGASAEFFVRYRNYSTGDIARLDNQRMFYSALFSLVRSVTWQEIVRLTPILQEYINTDLSTTECASLGIELLRVPSSNILLGKLPVSDATEPYGADAVDILVADPQATADMLNEYFRADGAQVDVSELNIPQLPKSSTLYDTNVQWMSDVDAQGGGEVGQAADATQTGDDILNEVNTEQQAQSEPAA